MEIEKNDLEFWMKTLKRIKPQVFGAICIQDLEQCIWKIEKYLKGED